MKVEEAEGSGNVGNSSGKMNQQAQVDEKEDADSFYQKLTKLHDSSTGLSFLFDFHKALFDLHFFYKEVIKRGGFYQVTKLSKWGEVERELNLKNPSVSVLADQLEKVYKTMLLHFEKIYHNPNKANSYSNKICLGPLGPKLTPRDLSMQDQSNSDSEASERMVAPQKPRSGFQIFLTLECRRLKTILGDHYSGSKSIQVMAIESWRSLPERNKMPYFEASEIDKKRYHNAMISYREWQESIGEDIDSG